jgi:hypothetical protein
MLSYLIDLSTADMSSLLVLYRTDHSKVKDAHFLLWHRGDEPTARGRNDRETHLPKSKREGTDIGPGPCFGR